MDTLPTSGVWQSYGRITCGYIAYLWGMAVLREDAGGISIICSEGFC